MDDTKHSKKKYTLRSVLCLSVLSLIFIIRCPGELQNVWAVWQSHHLHFKRNRLYKKNHQYSLPVKYIVKLLSLKRLIVFNPKRSGFFVNAAGGVKGVEMALTSLCENIGSQEEPAESRQILLLVSAVASF